MLLRKRRSFFRNVVTCGSSIDKSWSISEIFAIERKGFLISQDDEQAW